MHSSAGHTVMSAISEQRQEPDDPLDRWRREKTERREEPQPRERRLDTALPTLDDIDRRIDERVAAEYNFMSRYFIVTPPTHSLPPPSGLRRCLHAGIGRDGADDIAIIDIAGRRVSAGPPCAIGLGLSSITCDP